MVSKSVLQKAAKNNIIKDHQVDPLYQFINDQESGTPDRIQDEPLKFVRSFGDIFITLGILLLVVAINLSSLSGYLYFIPVVVFVLLAEWLVGLRKLVLPGIALLLSILFFVSKAVPLANDNTATISFAIMSITSLVFYLRYKMPFSLLPLAIGLVAIPVVQIGIDVLNIPVVFVGLGLVVFAIAFWFDSQDTKRVSHLSDNAFWLYLLAAPLFVHGIMVSLLTSEQIWINSFGKEMLMIAFFAVFFLLSLLIDRRAILISTQLYIIYAFTQLLQDKVNSTQDVIIYILMALAIFVIYFGTYWYKTRLFVFGFLTNSVISKYIPDLKMKDVSK